MIIMKMAFYNLCFPGLCALLLLPNLLLGQDDSLVREQAVMDTQSITSSLKHNSRVRVTYDALSRKRITGRLISIDSNMIEIRKKNGEFYDISRSQISKMELGRGAGSHWKWGMLIGTIPGIAISTMIPNSGIWREMAIANTIMATVGGALWGSLIGWRFKRTKWEPVYVPEVVERDGAAGR